MWDSCRARDQFSWHRFNVCKCGSTGYIKARRQRNFLPCLSRQLGEMAAKQETTVWTAFPPCKHETTGYILQHIFSVVSGPKLDIFYKTLSHFPAMSMATARWDGCQARVHCLKHTCLSVKPLDIIKKMLGHLPSAFVATKPFCFLTRHEDSFQLCLWRPNERALFEILFQHFYARNHWIFYQEARTISSRVFFVADS